MNPTPTPAALRAAKAVIKHHNKHGHRDTVARECAEIIDREGLREAAEALRACITEMDRTTIFNGNTAPFEKARAALARLEATE